MKLPLKILIHIIFWLVFLGITVVYTFEQNQIEIGINKFPHIVINTLWAIITVYLFYLYFIKFFEQGKFVKYLIFSVLVSFVINTLFNPLHKIFFKEYEPFQLYNYLAPVSGTFILAQCGTLIRGFENWMANIKLKADLENRNLKNELELLKSQVNPHFLFNTLNNIDTLIHKSPDDASRSLLSLSDMMRYMIYETNVDFVPMEKELEYLKHYISLQKLRLKKKDFVKVDLSKNVKGNKIAPMLLLPFIENAFKYVATPQILPAIEITLNSQNGNLYFICKNYFNDDVSKKIHTGGVGLENVKRRLELIYPDKHVLEISKQNNIFKVELKLFDKQCLK